MALTIASEGAVFFRELTVDLHIEVIFVDDQQRSVEEVVGGRVRRPIIRLRIFLIEIQKVDAGLVQASGARWNDWIGCSIGDGLVERVLDNKTGGLKKIIREVIARRCDIDNRNATQKVLPLSEALSGIVGKEEGLGIGLLPKDRSAEGGAKLVLPQRGFLSCRSRLWNIEIVSGVQSGVAQKLEDVAVIVVGARLDDRVDGAAVAAAVARVGVLGLFRELLNGVDGREESRHAVMVLLVANAIQKRAIFLRARAVDGEVRGAALLRIGDAAGGLGCRRDSARAQVKQLIEVTAVQGQIPDGFFRAEVADSGAFGFEQFGIGLDLDCLRGRADGQCGISGHTISHFQPDVLFHFAEAGSLDDNFVIARMQRRRHIDSLRV